MRQCPQCNRVFANDTAYCLEDGSLLNDTHDSEATFVRTAQLIVPDKTETSWRYKVAEQPKKRRGWWIVVIIALALLLAGAGITLLILNNSQREAASTSTTSTPSPESATRSTPTRTPHPRPTPASPGVTDTPAYTPQPQSFHLGDEFIELAAGEYRTYTFALGERGGTVRGSFAAQGGIGNDVLVCIAPASEMSAFKSGYPFRAFYQSGKVHGDGISVPLPAGSYVLVFKSPTPFTTRHIRNDLVLISN